jgi:hypothetical protein
VVAAEAGTLLELIRPADDGAGAEASPNPPPVRYRSGRTLQLVGGSEGAEEGLQVFSPDGQVELSVRFTPEGPVLSFSGARLDLSQTSEVNLQCERLTLYGSRRVEVVSGGELVVRGQEGVHVDGENVFVNCGDRAQFQS